LVGESSWYCSKLVWKAYMEKANIDLSGNQTLYTYVYPDEIYVDNDTSIFATGT